MPHRENLRQACWSYIMTNLVPQEGHDMQFNIAEAKARFSELVQKALLGEEVIIAKDHKPLLKLVPLRAIATGAQAGLRERAAPLHGTGFR